MRRSRVLSLYVVLVGFLLVLDGMTVVQAKPRERDLYFFHQLLEVPFGKSPDKLPLQKSWKVTIDRVWDEDYPKDLASSDGAVRQFEKTTQGAILTVYSHMQPSLKDHEEFLSWGQIRFTREDEKEAKTLYSTLMLLLERQGATFRYPTQTDGWWWELYQQAQMIRTAQFTGVLSLEHWSGGSPSQVVLAIWHPDFDWFYRERKVERFWQQFRDHAWRLPPRLIKDLQDASIPTIIGEKNWLTVQKFSRQKGRDTSRDERFPMPFVTLVTLHEKVANAVPNSSRPLALKIFQNFLGEFVTWAKYHEGGLLTSEEIALLKAQAIRVVHDHFSDMYWYLDDPFVELAEKHLDTYWGQYAFVRLMGMGFMPGERFGISPKPVGEKGLAFLVKYPQSPFVPDVMFFLGNAEETVWNTGYPQTDSKFRDRALTYYDKLLQTPKAQKYSNHLAYTLPRLRAGYATANMLYWCFCD